MYALGDEDAREMRMGIAYQRVEGLHAVYLSQSLSWSRHSTDLPTTTTTAGRHPRLLQQPPPRLNHYHWRRFPSCRGSRDIQSRLLAQT